jgi:hypothetical protein
MTGDGNSANGWMAFGKVLIQTGKVAAKRLGCLDRAGHERGVNASASEIGAYTNPAQCWIFKAGLGAIRAGVCPAESADWSIAIERGKSLVGRRSCCTAGRASGRSRGRSRACSGDRK